MIQTATKVSVSSLSAAVTSRRWWPQFPCRSSASSNPSSSTPTGSSLEVRRGGTGGNRFLFLQGALTPSQNKILNCFCSFLEIEFNVTGNYGSPVHTNHNANYSSMPSPDMDQIDRRQNDQSRRPLSVATDNMMLEFYKKDGYDPSTSAGITFSTRLAAVLGLFANPEDWRRCVKLEES